MLYFFSLQEAANLVCLRADNGDVYMSTSCLVFRPLRANGTRDQFTADHKRVWTELLPKSTIEFVA